MWRKIRALVASIRPLPLGFFSIAFIFLALAAPSAMAQERCTPLGADIPVGSTLASAGFFANLRRASNSISYLMDQLIAKAETKASEVAKNENSCSRSCSNSTTAIVFTSTPHLTLADYGDSASCAQLFQATQLNPIRYLNREFDSREDAEDWYDDLTQGDGPDGEDLYARCPGQCSPSYSSLAHTRNGKFVVSTSIVCGHARDKDDNQYRLTASVRWVCPDQAA